MKTVYDQDGQPPKRFYAPRVSERQVAELLGLCKGMICDGEVSDEELTSLRRWLGGHPDATLHYPGNVLATRLLQILEDGHVSDDEREELSDLLLSLTGETEEHDQPLNLSTRLPFDDPTPTILFDDFEHVFTGKMLYGTRKDLANKVLERNGRVGDNVTKRTNFLVIGPIGSAAWLESTHGRKILRAVELRSQGSAIRIVSEEDWIQALDLT
jgi:NAD-dependent DNA ligase